MRSVCFRCNTIAAFAVLVLCGPWPARALLPCPAVGATVSIRLDAAAITSSFRVELSGARLEASCEARPSLAGTYTRQLDCHPSQAGDCIVEVAALQPGRWLHRIAVTGVTGESQRQARRMLLLDGGAGRHTLSWRIFPSVFTIRSLADSAGRADCLRAALAAVATAVKPALIQFASDLVGTIVRSSGLQPLTASDVTLDAIAPDGSVWQRTLDGNGLDEPAFIITGARDAVVGLRFTNTGGNNDVVLITGASANDNTLSQVKVVGRALVTCGKHLDGCVLNDACRIPDASQPQGVCGDDGIAVRGNAGGAGPNRIEHSDISGAYDKGVKVSDGGVALVETSYIHDNRDGGIQATLSGTVTAAGNLIENNGGTNSANGLAANGPSSSTPTVPSVLTTRGNLTRYNSLRGISVRSFSLASLRDDFACDNGTPGHGTGFGLAVSGDNGLAPVVTVRGFASVFNLDGGANIAGEAQVDFGTTADPGYNAFAANGTAQSPRNFENPTGLPISAAGCQWEHCGRRPTCDDGAIAAADVAGPVVFAPALANRWNHEARIDAVEPTFGAAGDLVRIYGHGFDAIEGQSRGGSCAEMAAANRCLPNRGNCVRIGTTEAAVVAATPTMLVVQLPATCVTPTRLTVRSRHGQKRLRIVFCLVPPDTH